MSSKESSWGGKRPGAGRKKHTHETAQIQISVPDHVKVRFLQICEARGLSQVKCFEQMVKRAKL